MVVEPDFWGPIAHAASSGIQMAVAIAALAATNALEMQLRVHGPAQPSSRYDVAGQPEPPALVAPPDRFLILATAVNAGPVLLTTIDLFIRSPAETRARLPLEMPALLEISMLEGCVGGRAPVVKLVSVLVRWQTDRLPPVTPI